MDDRMKKGVVVARATFQDAYAGDVPVELRKSGKGYLWSSPESFIHVGYRAVRSPERALYNARIDRRFSEVTVNG